MPVFRSFTASAAAQAVPEVAASLRFGARAWQLLQPGSSPRLVPRLLAVAASAAVDVWIIQRRRDAATDLRLRLAVDAVDIAVWTALTRDVPSRGPVLVPSMALTFELAFCDRRRAWTAPLTAALTAMAARAATGQPVRLGELWPSLVLTLPGLALSVVDRSDARRLAERSDEVEARAAAAVESELAELAFSTTDSLSDLIRDAAHKLELAGGADTERRFVEEWKSRRLEFIGRSGHEFLRTVLLEWERGQSHPDLSRQVGFTLPDESDALLLLNPDQRSALLDQLDENRLGGLVPVRVASRRRRALVLAIGEQVIDLPGPTRMPARLFDRVATTQGMTALLMLLPMLPGEGRCRPRACVPPAALVAAHGVWAARRTPSGDARRRVVDLALGVAMLAWHASSAAATQRDHPDPGASIVRSPSCLATAGHASLIGLTWRSQQPVERLLSIGTAVAAVGFAWRRLPPRRRLRSLLADLCWSASSATLMHSIARATDRLDPVYSLDDSHISALVQRARSDAATFFAERIDRVGSTLDDLWPTLDPELSAIVRRRLDEARVRCERLQERALSSWTTTRPNAPAEAPSSPGPGFRSSAN
ncbi:MAG: hypothetical protein ACT4RN_03635 [Pseudonocardia sp.]